MVCTSNHVQWSKCKLFYDGGEGEGPGDIAYQKSIILSMFHTIVLVKLGIIFIKFYVNNFSHQDDIFGSCFSCN